MVDRNHLLLSLALGQDDLKRIESLTVASRKEQKIITEARRTGVRNNVRRS
jgi:hypothetical protein